jgi:hypothetical protein
MMSGMPARWPPGWPPGANTGEAVGYLMARHVPALLLPEALTAIRAAAGGSRTSTATSHAWASIRRR